ncbi:cell cycle checkpoint protein rad17, putative [Ixodes scapularis]|uniref:Cell cycle checkpoint protein rad17, putative n=1 Tax=Ixodes scapularis TaxID=6945 RepID=B7QIN2_IXOSC|nr:cell cycle checkpoint protein rad17, putative [Ixodes scapularis]|eukprot:XP_002415039.1 cell cycle checkpoint protein rad17, putative [Ixodes scapularis]
MKAAAAWVMPENGLFLEPPGAGAPLLLLCGPAGAGKTATVLCLAGQLGLTLHEWASPAKTEWAPRMQGPVEAFEAFLFQCSRYRPLDLPNAFLRDADAFHQVLRRYRRTCRTPLVFVVSESSDNLEYRLFPRELVAELGVSKIAFNPVAPTSMSKVLAAVVDKATARYKVSHLPTPDDLEQIAASSAGDVRNAINALQFFCSAEQGPAGPMQPAAAKKPRRRRKPRDGPQGEAGGAAPAGSRDCSLQLFHSLGKMLYCKRDPSRMADSDRLPKHMAHLEKPPATEVPEEVFGRTQVSADMFSLFLHHNAARFYADVHTAALCTDWFSQADFFLSEWSVRKKLFEVKNAFRGCHSTGSELQLDLIPFLALLRAGDLSPSMRAMVDEIGILDVGATNRKKNEMLAERDWIDERAENSVDFSGNSVEELPEFPDDDDDDEMVIEEFDD